MPRALTPDQAPEAEFFRPADGHWLPDQPPSSRDVGDEDGRGDVALEQQEFQ